MEKIRRDNEKSLLEQSINIYARYICVGNKQIEQYYEQIHL